MIFEGVIPAIVTPFSDEGDVDVAALVSNAEWMVDGGVRGLVSTGTMGESQSLSVAERRLVVETLVEATSGRSVTVGVSSETPGSSVALAADAAAAGAQGLMLLPPLGYEGDDREIEAFYRAVAESTDLPIMAYNNPKASGTDMRPELVAQLAEIDGVVAVKECSGDARRIAEIRHIAPSDFEVLVGGDDWALEGFCAGATGGYRASRTSPHASAPKSTRFAERVGYGKPGSCTRGCCRLPGWTCARSWCSSSRRPWT